MPNGLEQAQVAVASTLGNKSPTWFQRTIHSTNHQIRTLDPVQHGITEHGIFYEANGVATLSREFANFAEQGQLPFCCVHVDTERLASCRGSVTTLELNRGWASFPLDKDLKCDPLLSPTDYGRDHHPRCFTYWMAGGGVKPGVVHGETDDFSYNIVKDPVHVRDFQATLLHLFGIDHERFSYKVQGLEMKLTGVEKATVVALKDSCSEVTQTIAELPT